MQIIREAVLTFVLLSCIVAGVAGSLEDGLPRPKNFDDATTTSYGPHPELTNPDGTTADCEWYGFANMLYPDSQTLFCLDEMRVALTNATENPPSSLKPYLYYTLRRMIDPANNESYCYQGCFNLDFYGAPASSPTSAPAPYLRGPASAPIGSPIGSPIYDDGPSMPPVISDPGPSMPPVISDPGPSMPPVISDPGPSMPPATSDPGPLTPPAVSYPPYTSPEGSPVLAPAPDSGL